MTTIRRITLTSLLCLTLLSPASLSFAENEVDEKRNQLIGYMLYKQLPSLHFSDKVVDDELAQAAFDLFLKQLDYQKRFLLREDVEELRRYALQIDDNLKNGSITLPDRGYELLSRRIEKVKKIVADIMSGDFDTSRDEVYETDPEKLDFAADEKGLRERWRKILKAQVISRYLVLLEEQENNGEKVKDAELWRQAREKVEKRNSQFFTRLNQESLQDHYDRYFNAVTRAFDPHTNYMAPSKKEDFDIHMRGSLEGIGALLREEDGYIKIVRIIPGSASALQGGLAAEDIVLEVAEGDDEPVEVTDMRLRDAVRLIRGPKGTEVRLTIKKPDGVIEIVPIVRDVVQIEETFVKSHLLQTEDGPRIGYIKIPSFYRDFEVSRNGEVSRNSTDDTREALREMKKENISGLILDLRDNGGGSLVDAVDITGLFLESGPVVQVKNSFGTRKVLSDEDEEIVYDGPLVVLVNVFSASASEILAAALQDYGRAVIVGGKHTHGKGTVQTIIDMNENVPLLNLRRYDDLGALKVTIQKFYRINGGSTQFRGVVPDVVLPDLYEHLKSGEQYLDYSLPWDHVSPVPFPAYASGGLDLEKIQKRSNTRVEKEEGLQIIAEEAQKTKERMENTRISLKMEDMIREREKSARAREMVGEHFQTYGPEDEFDSTSEEDQPGNDENTSLEELKEDPYVSEAIRVIDDILSRN